MKKIILILTIFLGANLSAMEVTKLPLRGTADYSFFFFSVYEAKLWAAKDTDLYSGRLGLGLTYKRDFTSEQIVSQTQKELVRAGIESSQAKKWADQLLDIFPDVSSGDTLLADFDPERGIVFYLNNKSDIGQVKDLEFSKAFLNIWLGPKTREPQMRDKLLGKGDS